MSQKLLSYFDRLEIASTLGKKGETLKMHATHSDRCDYWKHPIPNPRNCNCCVDLIVLTEDGKRWSIDLYGEVRQLQ